MQQGSFDPTTNKEHWIDTIWIFDQNNNLVDLSDMDVELAVRDRDTHNYLASGNSNSPSPSGTIEVVGKGIIQFVFPKFGNAKIPRSYEVGVTLTNRNTGITQQLSIMSLNILDGIVP